MKSKLTFIILVMCKILQSQTIYSQWSKQFNGNYINPFCTTTDAAGNVFTSGYMHDTIDFDPGPGVFQLISHASSAYVSKQDPNGNLLWAVNLATSSNARYDLKTDALGNVYSMGFISGACDFDPGPGTYTLSTLTSTVGSTRYIWKLDANGNFVWAKLIPNHVFVNSFQPDASGNLFICGSFAGTADLGFGSSTSNHTSQGITDAFISKLDASGNLIDVKQFPSGNNAGILSLTFGSNSDFYAVGSFSGSIDANPGPVTNMLTGGGQQHFNTRFDASGNFISVTEFPSPAGSYTMNGITNDAFGNVYAYGTFTGVCDFDPSPSIYTVQASTTSIFLYKLDPSGNFSWARTLDLPGNNYFYGYLKMDGGNNLYLSGISFITMDCDPGPGTSTVNPGAFLTVLNASGNFIEATNIPGVLFCVDSPGNIYSASQLGVSELIEKYGSVLTGLTTQNKETINLNVFPNPANGLFNIKIASLKNSYTVDIFDLLGQKLLEQKMDSEEATLDLRNYQAGIYLLRLSDKGSFAGQIRLIKE